MEKLKKLGRLYQNSLEITNKLKFEFLEEAFKDREEYAYPSWLSQVKRDMGELVDVWCSYRHDGAFVAMEKVKRSGKTFPCYFVSGYEDMEYSSDYVSDVETCDTEWIAEFVEGWINSDTDNNLKSFAELIKSMPEPDEDEIIKKADEIFGYDISDCDISEVLKWAKAYNKKIKA